MLWEEGEHVEVFGLVNAPELNGDRATVDLGPPHGAKALRHRNLRRTTCPPTTKGSRASPPPAAAAGNAAGAGEFAEGDEVEAHGLVGAAELNGLCGRVHGRDGARIRVSFPAPHGGKSLRPANLRKRAAGAAGWHLGGEPSTASTAGGAAGAAAADSLPALRSQLASLRALQDKVCATQHGAPAEKFAWVAAKVKAVEAQIAAMCAGAPAAAASTPVGKGKGDGKPDGKGKGDGKPDGKGKGDGKGVGKSATHADFLARAEAGGGAIVASTSSPSPSTDPRCALDVERRSLISVVAAGAA
eukprot:gene7859-34313_t